MYKSTLKRGENPKYQQNYRIPTKTNNTYGQDDYNENYYSEKPLGSQKPNAKQYQAEGKKKIGRGNQNPRKNYNQEEIYSAKNPSMHGVVYVAKKAQKQEDAISIADKHDETPKTCDETPVSIVQDTKLVEEKVEESPNPSDIQSDIPTQSVENPEDKATSQTNGPSTEWINQPDTTSMPAAKPIIETPSVKSVKSEEDKDTLSSISESETIQSKQTSTTTQNVPPQPFYPGMPSFSNMFHAPYIVFPQPNGTMVMQPIYQFPMINMPSHSSGSDDQLRSSQPYYLIPSNLGQLAESQMSGRAPPTMAPMAPQFMPFSPFYPGLMMSPLLGNQMAMQPNFVGERENLKNNIQEPQLKDETLSDNRRDD